MTEVDPRTELANLTLALRSAVRRTRRSGVRRVAPVGRAPVDTESHTAPHGDSERGSDSSRGAGGGGGAPPRIDTPDPGTSPQATSAQATSTQATSPRATSPKTTPPQATPPQAPPPTLAIAQSATSLPELRAKVAACRACPLCESRTQTVFMDGEGTRQVLFVGEAPGFHEDEQGIPFVGPAGALLTDIIEKGMGLTRAEVSIANVLKCRPPENRDPSPEEKTLCTPFLDRQIELLDPKVIIPLGRHASNHVLGTDEPMGRLRGRVHTLGGRSVVPTFHPAYLLRTPSAKRDCWKDIQLAMTELGLPKPSRETR